jgi:predicted Zn-dependent peptidase
VEFREQILGNGLEVVAECAPEAYSAAVGFFVKTGSRDEPVELAGVSHFLEHMVFKGTASRTADDVNRQFDEMGAQYNAFTSEESTVFHAAVLPEQRSAAVELLADILRPALRRDDFDTEKQVIVEEIRMYEDQPPFGAEDKCRAAYFGRHPLGQSVLGSLDSVGGLSLAAMQDYFRRRYSPGNIVLVGAGKIDFPALVDDARRYCGHWEPSEASRSVGPAAPQAGFQALYRESATQQYAVLMSSGPDALDADRYSAKLLATILGDDTGSRFYWELIDSGLAEQASLTHYEHEGAGLFITYLSCEPALAVANLERIRRIFDESHSGGVTPQELAQAKSKINSRVVLTGERPHGRLFAVGADWVQRRQYRSVRDDLEAVAAITRDDVHAVLAKYPLAEGMTVTIGPLAASALTGAR